MRLTHLRGHLQSGHRIVLEEETRLQHEIRQLAIALKGLLEEAAQTVHEAGVGG